MLLYLKIKPNQRFDRIENKEGQWIVRVKAPAVEGKANQHLIDFLGRVLKLPKSKIQIKNGRTNPLKCLEIDCDESQVLRALQLHSGNLHNNL
jgi:uncharacterized protein (TIGR00251 family)